MPGSWDVAVRGAPTRMPVLRGRLRILLQSSAGLATINGFHSPLVQETAMGLFDKMRHELIDIIEWTEPADSAVLAYRYPRYQNEIKMGAKLTVREGQAAVFVNEGQIADVFPPGMYTLETQNLPVLATLKGWAYGF